MQPENTESPTPDLAEESTLTLVVLMLAGFIRVGISAIPERVRHSCISICGMIVLATPLLLWISWSKIVFYLVLSFGGCALLIIWLLIRFTPDEFF